MDSKWSVEMEDDFIQELKKYKYIWSPSHPEYSKQTLRNKAFEDIGKVLLEHFPEREELFTIKNLFKKFKNLRTYYQKVVKEMKNSTSGQEGQGFMPKWVHYPTLSFLGDNFEPVASTSNMTLSTAPGLDEPSTSYAESCLSTPVTVDKLYIRKRKRSETPSTIMSRAAAALQQMAEAPEETSEEICVKYFVNRLYKIKHPELKRKWRAQMETLTASIEEEDSELTGCVEF